MGKLMDKCEHIIMVCRNCKESFRTEESKKNESREMELKIALSAALRWMGKALADGAYKDCAGNADNYFSHLNGIMNKD